MKKWIMEQLKRIEQKLDENKNKEQTLEQIKKDINLMSCYSDLLLRLASNNYMGK